MNYWEPSLKLLVTNAKYSYHTGVSNRSISLRLKPVTLVNKNCGAGLRRTGTPALPPNVSPLIILLELLVFKDKCKDLSHSLIFWIIIVYS